MRTTSPQPHQPGRVQPPERSPAAIRAELSEAMRAEFDTEYLAALEEARTTFRLERLNQVLDAWWLSTWARRSPRHEQAMAAGTHPKVVSELLGHSSIGLTLDTYSHVIPSLAEEAAGVIAAAVLHGAPTQVRTIGSGS